MRLLALLILFNLGNSVSAKDIYPRNDREAFKIEISTKKDHLDRQLIGFRICNIYTFECERIGSKKYYLKKRLTKQHRIEVFQAILYNMGYSITLVGGNWFLGFSYSNLITNKATYFLTIPATSYLSHRTISLIDVLNPMTQIGQAKVSGEQILNDKDVEVRDIEKTAFFIASVLKKIDQE
jgi:hypothetical protein